MDTIQLTSIKTNEHNPRKMSVSAIEKLKESIERDPQFMELRPIVIDEYNVILGGNQRYMACCDLGMTEVPASWIKKALGLSEEQRKRFVLVDNSPDGMSGEWDFDILTTNWEKFELVELGLTSEVSFPADLDSKILPDAEKFSIRISFPTAESLSACRAYLRGWERFNEVKIK